MNAFALSMSRPHETLGLTQPMGRRLPSGLVAWNVGLLLTIVLLGCLHIFQVNAAAAKTYTLRRVEKRVEILTTEAMALQAQIAADASMQALNARAAELGFVPIERLEFVNPAAQTYALAR